MVLHQFALAALRSLACHRERDSGLGNNFTLGLRNRGEQARAKLDESTRCVYVRFFTVGLTVRETSSFPCSPSRSPGLYWLSRGKNRGRSVTRAARPNDVNDAAERGA